MGSEDRARAQDPRLKTKYAVLEDLRRRTADPKLDIRGRLKGKVGIITGAGQPRGIGYATAHVMARQGVAHLYLLDFIDQHFSSLSDELRKTYPETEFTLLQGDAASSKVISTLVDRVIEEQGHLDFFFANAGVAQGPKSSKADWTLDDLKKNVRGMDIHDDEFMDIMRINTLSVFLAVKFAAPAMAKLCPEKGKTIPGGSIVLTASVAGLGANAGSIPYSASKAAVISLARTSASALTGMNVRTNAICPGLIDTDMPKAIFLLAEAKGVSHEVGKLNPLLREGLPSEIAHVAAFLASDGASYINGQAITVDGGLSSSMPFVPPRL